MIPENKSFDTHVLVIEPDPFVQEDICQIILDVFPDARVYRSPDISTSQAILDALDTLNIAVVAMALKDFQSSGLADAIAGLGSAIVHLDDREQPGKTDRPDWINLPKPFTQSSLSDALVMLSGAQI